MSASSHSHSGGPDIRSLIERLERADYPWQRLAWSVAAIIFLRGMLEGILERDHVVGIRAVPGVSQAMLFIHFPASFAAAFLVIVLTMVWWSHRSVSSVIVTVAKLWPLTLIPPLFDVAVSGGRGYVLGYLGSVQDVQAVVRGFLSFSARQLPGVTPGMRLEIFMACLGILAYVGVWRGILRGIGAALTAFVGLLALGSLPLLGGVGAEGWMQAGGFGNLQSHRLGLVNLGALVILGLAVWHRADRGSLGAFLCGFRWLRTLLYASLTGLGVWIVHTLQRPWMKEAFTRPGDWLSLAAVVTAEVLCFQSAAVANDLADAPWDGGSPRKRMLREGMDPALARRLSVILAATGLAVAICVQYAVFLIALAQLCLAGAYSQGPFRLKRVFGVSTAVIATAAVLAVAAGGAMIAREWVFAVLPGGLVGALWLSFFLGFGVKDLADEASDRASGTRSLPVLVGGRCAARMLAGAALVSFSSFPFLSGIRGLILPGIVLGLGCATAVALRRTWSERAALLLVLTGVVGVGAGVCLDREWVSRSRRLIPDLCAERAGRTSDGAVRAFGIDDSRISAGALVVRAWGLIGQYPWLIPRATELLDPAEAVALLRQASEAGICPALVNAASLDPLATVGSTDEWCHALQGAITGGRGDGPLMAVAARQAERLCLPETAELLRWHGIRGWPDDASVWAEMAHGLAIRGDLAGALRAALRAQACDPASDALQRDVAYLRDLVTRTHAEGDVER